MFSIKTASMFLATATVLSLTPMSNAQAALVGTSPSCSPSNITNPTAISCSGAWEGNDANQQNDVLAQLMSDFQGSTGAGIWSFIGKSDDANAGPFIGNSQTTTGTLSFDIAQTGYFAIALKASNTFSLYLLNGGTNGISSFDFNTIGAATNQQGLAQNLSHASLYTFKGDTTPVPTPALLPGLIGMGFAAWRKRKTNQSEANA